MAGDGDGEAGGGGATGGGRGGGNDSEGPGGPGGDTLFGGPWWAAGRCPDPRTFAAFLDRRLPQPHHDRVLGHVVECRACRKAFLIIAAALREIGSAVGEEPERDEVPFPEGMPQDDIVAIVGELAREEEREASAAEPTRAGRRRQLRTAPRAAAVAAAIGMTGIIGIAIGFVLGWWLPSRDPRAALAAVVPRERPFASRFTGGIPWSPAAVRYRGYDLGLDLSRGAVSYLAAAELGGSASESPNANELGTIGAAQTLGGRVESGVETLTRAVAVDPESPELLNDLGAALLARAESSDRLDVEGDSVPVREQHDDDLPAALEAIDQALEKSPRLPEALFNRALALERLFLRASAKKAWEEYLEVDDGSPWAAEARQRSAAIAVPVFPDPVRIRAEVAAIAAGGDRAALAEIVLRQRHLARRGVQEDSLPGWADNWLGGNAAEAGRKLASARAIAAEWEAQTSDPTLLAAVAEVEGASPLARARLARAHQALGVAARAFAAFDLATVRTAADRALEELPPDSPAAPWARVHRLACVYYLSGDVASEADALLDHAGDDLTSRGAALWIRGLWQAKRGGVSSALADLREAFAAFERLEEREPTVWLRLLIGEAYGYMGASGPGWHQRRAAMKDLAGLTDRKRPFAIFLGSALVALAEGRSRVAADLLGEAFAMPASMEPYEAVQAFLWRSRIQMALGRPRAAADDFIRASTWFPKLGQLDAGWLGPEFHLVRGLRASDPEDAIAALSRAIVEFRQSGQQRRLPEVLLARAQAQQRAGRYGAADEDLRQAAVLHQQQQGAGYPELLRAPPLDRPDRLFGERVKLALRSGRAEEAFAVAEAARARVFLAGRDTAAPSSLARRPVEPLRLADVRSRLEAGSTMLFFAVLQDRIVQWRVERHRSSVAVLPITPNELVRLGPAFLADLEADVWTPTTRELAMRLYAALIEPAHLGKGPLIVVPDGELHGLPFAALVDPATKRFLVEDRPVTVAPSATAYLVARDRLRAIGVTPPVDAFVVGDPRVSVALFPGLHPLPGAWTEARAVAALYPRRVLLLRDAATRPAFIAALGRHQVVHFTGHAVINRTNPERSSLPLADDGGPGGSLVFGTDIAGLDLGSTRAVVLSGCDTASGKVLDGEGPLSLARAFLAAGVPSVVASLWPIADQPAAPLMTAFHQQLRRGEAPAAALRSAQLTVLRGSAAAQRSPTVWASLQAFGG